MKIETDKNGEIILKEVYSGVGLETRDKEFFGICMRDTGFEFTYGGKSYEAKNGILNELGINNVTDNNDTCCDGGGCGI